MKTSIKNLQKSQIEILVEIPTEEFKKFYDETIFSLGEDLEVKGFRKGKVPKEILEKEIGQERIFKEAVEVAIRKNYLKAILENKIEAISQPKIEILSSKEGLIFKALISVLPEIILPDYKKIASEIKRQEISITKEEIEESLIQLQKSRAKFIFENRPAKKEDFVEIEFQSPKIEGGLKRKDSFILGQGHLIPGFEENLEGMNPGEEKEFSLRFPESHFQKEFAGNLINFKVKMNSVQKVELPEINDEFAKSLGKFESFNNLKENIKEGLIAEKEIAENQRVRQEILAKITEKSSLEIPKVLIETEKNRLLEDLKGRIFEIFKISFSDYLNKIKKSEEEIKNSFSPQAEERIKNSLILREISNREKIEVSEEEIKGEINQFLKNYPIEKAKELDLEKLKIYYEEVIRDEKTFRLLESLTR